MKNLAQSPERSIVTVLVVDMVNSTGHIADRDPDEAQELLDKIYDHLNGAVRHAGGIFVNYSGDGGVAMFGWPASLEEHADRACEAAWLIQLPALEGRPIRDSRRQPVRFRIGIHSGLVGLRRMDMDIGERLDPVGGTVHIAASLQKRAEPDSALITSQALELCRLQHDVAPHEDLPVLARIKARAYRLMLRPHPSTRKEPRIYRSPLVGRKAERDKLQAVLIDNRDGYRAAAVIGEPGIGKSRLVAVAIEDAQASGMSVLVFHGDSRKSTTPYSAMRSLIFEVLALDEGTTDDEVVEALRSVNVDIADNSPLGIVLLTRRNDGGSRTSGVTQTQVARVLVETLRTLTEGTPILIVIEDIHLLDPESMHCLRLLRYEEHGGSMALLVTGRPEAAAEARQIANTVLRLDLLPREEMRKLALVLWPSDVPSQAISEQVVDRADGVPFVLEQIILSLGSGGDGIVALVPQSVRSVIHARLNRLSQEAKACAQALSVLGNEVEVDVALRVLDVDAETFQRDRAELERLEIIQPSAGTSIRFRHASVAEACSETLPGTRRHQLHGAAIGAILSIYSDISSLYERLALHAEGARDDQKALEYLLQAGLRARRSSANGSLFLIFQRAMACIERVGHSANHQFVDFVLMACSPLLQIGEFSKMKPYLPRALELAEEQDRRDRVCAALCNMGTVSWFEGRYGDSREQCERALVIAESLGSLPLIFAAKFMLASALWGMAEMARAIAMLFELRKTFDGPLENARMGANAIPASMVRSYLSWFMMEVGRYEEGLPHVEQALEIAVRQGEPYSELLARNGLGRNLLKLKRPHDAAICLEAAISLVEQYGYDAIRPHITGQLASALARIGQGRRAVDMVEAWLARGLEARTGRLELYYLNAGYAEALLDLGDRNKALAAAEKALDVARRLPNPCLIVQGLGLRARLMAEVEPGSGVIERDRKEQAELCRRYGLFAET